MVIDVVGALRQVYEDEDVVERIGDHCHSADRNVKGWREDSAAPRLDFCRSVICRRDEPVRFVAMLRGENNLGVSIGYRERGLTDRVIAPSQLMSESVAVEREPRVDVWDSERDGVNLAKQRSVHRDTLSDQPMDRPRSADILRATGLAVVRYQARVLLWLPWLGTVVLLAFARLAAEVLNIR